MCGVRRVVCGEWWVVGCVRFVSAECRGESGEWWVVGGV